MKTTFRTVILVLLACVLMGCGQKASSERKGEKARAPAVEDELDEDMPASADDEA